ncbi:transcriptional regulator [Serratia quinivorans]|uniref:winged helix-turn-helix domain-containing protein n=1 Tax=Serratia quinivorans TaxID=137545 RepID=UPI00217CAD9C|nr:helix-turn-helix domain-containing protein [Serratia quinivorans]CAI1958909.1 Transcriptional regulatory protein, C terminal [Serratia quinivorans]CAI2160702.1 Transcriptional regulatory protein, C terminal [Serratia quinivorans]
MKYLINGVAKYNSLDGTLFCPDNSVDMLTLSCVGNELLGLFVKNNGVSLRREVILNEIWERKGLNASSNNLNNHVSMLRKALSQCGLANLITTIPKHGFVFEAESLNALDDEVQQVKASPGVAADLSPIAELEKSGKRMRVVGVSGSSGSLKRKWLLVVFSVCAFVIALGVSLDVWKHPVRTQVFTLDQCRFYLAGEGILAMARPEAIKVFKTLLRRKPLDCTLKSNVYFFVDSRIDSVGKAFTNHLVVYCPYESKLPCDNSYVFNYENKDKN